MEKVMQGEVQFELYRLKGGDVTIGKGAHLLYRVLKDGTIKRICWPMLFEWRRAGDILAQRISAEMKTGKGVNA